MQKRIIGVGCVFCGSRRNARAKYFLIIYDGTNEKASIKMVTELVKFRDIQTLVAFPNEEAKRIFSK